VEAPALPQAKAAKRERNTVRNGQRRRALTAWQWRSVLERWGHKCVYCGRVVADKEMNRDHFVPIRLGGTLAKGNVVPACAKCNRVKHDTEPLEYMVGLEHGLARYAEIVNALEGLR